MNIEWVYNDKADTWELYIDKEFIDFIRINRSSDSPYYFRGANFWNDLDEGKSYMEDYWKCHN